MHKKLVAYAVLPVIGFALLGIGVAYAGYGQGQGMGQGGGMRGGMGQGAGLISAELREDIRSMSYEEHAELRQSRQAERGEHRGEMEDFTGISHEEMREMHWNGESVGDVLEAKGITESEAEDFLTERAEERVDFIVEAHDLDGDAEETLRDRITGFVDRILGRWFGSN